jgi:hypothetical protein
MRDDKSSTQITVSEEFAQGYDAWAIRDEPVERNPYLPRSKEHRRWNSGWYAARLEGTENGSD